MALRLGELSVLTVPVAHGSLWVWFGAESAVDDSLVAAAATDLDARGFGIAVGASGHDVDGLRRSHREAQSARRVLTARDRAGVARYRDLVVEALIHGDSDATRAFVAAELGALAGAGPNHARLRRTLLEHFDNGGRARLTAERLGVHENTVHHRIRRAEEILGRPLDRRRLELHLALRLADYAR